MFFILEANVYLAIFYCFYWLLLQKHAFHAVNRFYLLTAVLVAVVLPFIYVPQAHFDNRALLTLNDTVPIPAGPVETQGWRIDIIDIIASVYLVGVMLVLLRKLQEIYKIYSMLKSSNKTKLENYTLINVAQPINTFSFFKYMFIGNQHPPTDRDETAILRHEQVHISQYHSLDVMFLELLCTLFWFNPVCRLYKRSLKQLHEYLADKRIITEHFTFNNFSNLLLNQTFNVTHIAIGNNIFNHSNIKNRLIMINKKTPKTQAIGKLLLVVPLLLIMLYATSCRKELQFANGIANISVAYNYNNSSLKEGQHEDLDRLTAWLLDHPNAEVELSAHTDQKGSSAYNLALSQQRAEMLKAYLVKQGISSKRLRAKGYGEEQLLIGKSEVENMKTEDEKEAAHQKNRRTEVQIIRM